MSKTIEPFVLDSFAGLFRDAAAFQEFVKNIESACQSSTTPFFSGGKIIGLTVSKECGKELLYDHIVTQWAKDPAQIDRIIASLEEEPVPMNDL